MPQVLSILPKFPVYLQDKICGDLSEDYQRYVDCYKSFCIRTHLNFDTTPEEAIFKFLTSLLDNGAKCGTIKIYRRSIFHLYEFANVCPNPATLDCVKQIEQIANDMEDRFSTPSTASTSNLYKKQLRIDLDAFDAYCQYHHKSDPRYRGYLQSFLNYLLLNGDIDPSSVNLKEFIASEFSSLEELRLNIKYKQRLDGFAAIYCEYRGFQPLFREAESLLLSNKPILSKLASEEGALATTTAMAVEVKKLELMDLLIERDEFVLSDKMLTATLNNDVVTVKKLGMVESLIMKNKIEFAIKVFDSIPK